MKRIGVFYSPGRDFGDALRGLRAAYPDDRLIAIIPPGFPAPPEADETVRTASQRYTAKTPTAALALLRQLRSQQFDVFAVLFPSARLRLFASLSGAPIRIWSAPDGRTQTIKGSPARIALGGLLSAARGRMTYLLVWLLVHLWLTRFSKTPHALL